MDSERKMFSFAPLSRRLSRRKVIVGIGATSLGSALLAACGGGQTAAPTTAPSAPQAVPSTAAAPAAPVAATAVPTTAAAATAAPVPTVAPTAAAQPTTAPAAATSGGAKEFVGAYPYELPPSGHFNTFIPHGITVGIYQDLFEMPLAKYYWATDKWMPLMATEWKFEPPDKFTVSLRKGAKWSDGKDFTSKDVLSTLWCQRLMRNVLWNYIDDATAPDDYTVTVHMSTPSTVVQRYMLEMHQTSAANYGQFGDKAAALFKAGKAIDSDEGKALVADFQKFRPNGIIAVGPYNIDQSSITNAQLTLTKVATAWNAAQVKFDKITLFNGETPTVTPLVLAKKVDYATHGFAPATLQALAQEGVRLQQVPTYGGSAILLNYGDAKVQKVLGDKRVRQALAMAVNGDDVGFTAGGVKGTGVKTWAGFSEVLVPLWLTKDQIGKLNKYTYNPDKAVQILDGLGWKKGSDGVYTTPDGTRAEFDLLSVTEYEDTMAIAQGTAQAWSKIGVKTTVRSETFTQQPIDIDKGNFQLAMGGFGSGDPHPHFAFVADIFTHNTLAANNGGKGMNFPLTQKTDSVGEIDLKQAVDDSALGLDVAKQKDLVFKIAQAYNELLPSIPIYERWANNPLLDGVHCTGWLPASDPIYTNSPYADSFTVLMILDGTLKPAGGM
ncbi:MAG TPA: ABC transporter substrate-binding protein [Chloroflexota bacterium]|nr:ABC transporter substrate-binding protein [Chloroflexota bacterium]